MLAKPNQKQTLWVLCIAIALLVLCIGGLWAYVKSADAQTGVQEASLTQIPEADKIAYTPEKYDNFMVGNVDLNLELERYEGSGLSKREILRLLNLQKAYAQGSRPSSKAPSLPGEDGFAIIPLDPGAFGGFTEYYILPEEDLSDEQLLMLIDHSAGKGEAANAETTGWKNCMREGIPDSNRYLSVGETLRRENLLSRLKKEGIRSVSPELTLDKLPLSTVGGIRLDKKKNRNNGVFHLYPLRELTDEELMQSLYLDYLDGYEYINASMDESLNPIDDAKEMRAFFEDLMGMPASAENTELTYRRKISTGEIHLHARFKSALVDGVETTYFTIMKMDTGEFLYTTRFTDDTTKPGQAYYLEQPKSNIDIYDSRWVNLAKEAVTKLTKQKITKASARSVYGTPDSTYLKVDLDVSLEDGSFYGVSVMVEDEMITSAQFFHHDYRITNDYIW